MAGIALTENPKLDTTAVNRNRNGTVDAGLFQVNESNWGWTHIDRNTARDPCRSAHAAMMVWFAKYNGNPPGLIKTTYAARTEAAMNAVMPAVVAQPSSPNPFSLPSRTKRDVVFDNR